MSLSSPTVSVVIPCHNYARFLPLAIESVLAQTCPPSEILVVDDSSTDDTPNVVKRYGGQVLYLRVEQRGAYGARNDSLPHLSGDYFLNLDADNWLEADFIEKTLNTLENAPPDIGYVYTQRRYFGDQEGVSHFPDFSPERLLRQGFVDMGSLIHMALVKKIGFDEGFNSGQGDRAFFLRLLQEGFYGQLCDEALLHYRVHGNSITRAVQKRHDHLRIQKKLIRKFPDLFDPSLKKELLEDARNRVLASLISTRDPQAPFTQRLHEFMTFLRYGWRHGECLNQLRHLLHPGKGS